MKNRQFLTLFTVFLTLFTLASCANLTSLQDPQVTLESIESISNKGMSPRFKLVLRVTNPNALDLVLNGMSFNLDLAGKDLLSGVANDIPTLRAYSETLVNVEASISLYDLLNLVLYLSKNNQEVISYSLQTTIDPVGFIAFNIEKKGTLTDDLLSGITGK